MRVGSSGAGDAATAAGGASESDCPLLRSGRALVDRASNRPSKLREVAEAGRGTRPLPAEVLGGTIRPRFVLLAPNDIVSPKITLFETGMTDGKLIMPTFLSSECF